MIITYSNIIKFFRYLWLILAFCLILYVLSNVIYTARELTYNLDFSKNITKNIKGWYPESRSQYFSGDNHLLVRAEPIYLQVYLPVSFDTLNISGSIENNTSSVRLGLKQKDGSWFWQNINQEQFDLNFPLKDAYLKNRRLEIILSSPDLEGSSKLYLSNNWQLEFKK